MTAIALATCTDQATLFYDETPLVDALEAQGMTVYPVVWNSPEIDWSSYDLVLIRNTWDYHQQIGVFRDWLSYLEQRRIPVLNPLPLLRWNIEKTYLQDLATHDVRIHETVFANGQTLSLKQVLDSQQWHSAVVKPIINGSGDNTWMITQDNASETQAQFDWLNQQIGMMIQPFAPQIQADGELSLVFFAGEYSHAVRKKPAQGHLLVQEEFGGSISLMQVESAIITQCKNTLDAVTKLTGILPTYARVDGFMDDDIFVLMELECIEPELYFTRATDSAKRFASHLIEAIQS